MTLGPVFTAEDGVDCDICLMPLEKGEEGRMYEGEACHATCARRAAESG